MAMVKLSMGVFGGEITDEGRRHGALWLEIKIDVLEVNQF